jgi:hypothetical protein
MEYSKDFKELLHTLPDNAYVGLGNPNAKILFIGKEAGSEIGSETNHGNSISWKKKELDYSKRYVPKESNIRNLNHTWQRYQKLHDKIFSGLSMDAGLKKNDKYEITFIENIFTTELSNLPAKNTNQAKRQTNFSIELEKRKQSFFRSKFIQQFPITVIFATDNKYIETYPGEVCALFKVRFSVKHNYIGKDSIWIHYSSDPENTPKLLIHTRQLTNSISKELTDNLAAIIMNFMRENFINIK